MQKETMISQFDFEGSQVAVFKYGDKVAIIAKELGRWLGYSKDGGKLTSLIGSEWINAFEENEDYLVLSGSELSDFKKILEVNPRYGSTYQFAPNLMILFEQGIYAVALKSDKPEALRLHKFLKKQVLPQIARDGKYDPSREVVNGELVSKVEIQRSVPTTYHEAMREALRLLDENALLEKENEELRPYADVGMAHELSKGSRQIKEFVKTFRVPLDDNHSLSIGAIRMFEWLRKKEYAYDDRAAGSTLPCQSHIKNGWFEVGNTTWKDRDGTIRNRSTMYVTPLGESGLIKRATKDKDFREFADVVPIKKEDKKKQISLF